MSKSISIHLRNALASLRVAESMEHPDNIKAFVREARTSLDAFLVELFEESVKSDEELEAV